MKHLKSKKLKGVSSLVFLTRGLPFVLALLLWFGALFVPTFAAIRGTPPALPERFSGLNRIALGWNDIKRQEKDNTCGLAVLSLLLAWHHADTVSSCRHSWLSTPAIRCGR